MTPPRTPARIDWRRLDRGALDGGYHLLGAGGQIAVGRWDGARFVFSKGAPFDFAPTHYQQPKLRVEA